MEHIIADSGLQFVVYDIEFNPSQPIMGPDGRVMSLHMHEKYDPFRQNRELDYLVDTPKGDKKVPLSNIDTESPFSPVVKKQDGDVMLNSAGLPILKDEAAVDLLYPVQADPASGSHVHSFQTLEQLQVKKDPDSRERVAAFELLLDRWIPVALFEAPNMASNPMPPKGWCRVKIIRTYKDNKTQRFRVIYAIDTTLSKQALNGLRPTFQPNNRGEHREPYRDYTLCADMRMMKNMFFTISPDMNGVPVSSPSSFSNYFGQILNMMAAPGEEPLPTDPKFRHVAYYSFFLNALRLLAPLSVRLYNPYYAGVKPIDVDLVLDIGNSRTCGILFENGDFGRRSMLELRDMTRPWIVYDDSFDMRLALRQADFGGDIAMPDSDEGRSLFKWRSMLRVGHEATRLMYRSLEEEGQSKKCTNYSSPKRYLWDTRPFEGNWEFIKTEDDPLNIRNTSRLYVDRLTTHLNPDGSISEKAVISRDPECHFSRSSLMMQVFVEIFRQAECQINSARFRTKHGSMETPRRLRNVIITAPTAMPNSEQVRLRRYALQAFELISHDGVERPAITVWPKPDQIASRPDYDVEATRDWPYDEATACQLVYLFAEVQKHYGGDSDAMFKLRGKKRPDMADLGFEGETLTIGSIDIGAGTTDLMICSYGKKPGGTIVPVPLFWDSFYLAGDDILRSIVQCLVIDGKSASGSDSIHSRLRAHLESLTPDELRQKHAATDNLSHKRDIENILRAQNPDQRNHALDVYAQDMIIDFFGINTANNDYTSRRVRVDFNSQISLAIARLFLEQLSNNYPQRTYTFDEIFAEQRPAAYVLEHFQRYFGFDFTTIKWEFDPAKVSDEILKKMTSLMMQLSLILHAYNVDIVMLAGRPTKLKPLTDLLLKFYPVAPDRLVRLSDYMVGNWYPFASGTGFITDQKTVVAVGAYIGWLASHGRGYEGFKLDFSIMAKKMGATANYIGQYHSKEHRIDPTMLTPDKSTYNLRPSRTNASAANRPQIFLGCKQLNTPAYESRPLYVLEITDTNVSPEDITIMISRSYQDNKEQVKIEDVLDNMGRNLKSSVEIREQSLVDTDSGQGNSWLDDGAFDFLSRQ